MEKQKRPLHLQPSQTIMIGFMLMILIGAALLTLPIASRSGESVGFLNALFTATSANCVTGLVVVNTMGHWTVFGKIVIITLIQFGGLGFITVVTIAMILLHRKITLRSRQVIQASFNQDDIGGMVKLIRKVIFVTLFFEGLGAVLLAITFYTTFGMSLWESIYQGVFHAISAFCNAGFDNLSTDSLTPFQHNTPFILIISALIIAGGIGFAVWSEAARFIKNPERKPLRFRFAHFSLHAKIVCVITVILLISGTLIFLLLEWSSPATLGGMKAWQKVQSAFFQSVTLRTAGFNSISQAGLSEASKFVASILMIFGGSPASTAGGMKTVTIGVILFSMISVFKGRKNLESFGRTMPLDLLQKALTVASMMLIVVFVSTMLLYITERSNPFPHTFLDLLFECSSAAGTVGCTAGITPHLSAVGKMIVIITMYLGRIGPVTMVVALNLKLHDNADDTAYPKERVIIG